MFSQLLLLLLLVLVLLLLLVVILMLLLLATVFGIDSLRIFVSLYQSSVFQSEPVLN